jgi:dihydroneopterin aldolase
MQVQKYNFEGTPMKQLHTVFLEKVRYHLPLGLYPGEKLCGNEILISISVSFTGRDTNASWLNYESLLAILHRNAKNAGDLLETLAQSIVDDVLKSVSEVQPERIEVILEKPQLPVQGYQATSAGFKLCWTA